MSSYINQQPAKMCRLILISIFLLFRFCDSRISYWNRLNYGNFLETSNGENDRPIIGVVSSSTPEGIHKKYPWAQSIIASSYVKYLEMAGAQVVPILISRTDDYYEDLFSSINGILFPGGEVSTVNSPYAKTATTLFKLAVKANDNKDYFPIWGTCLGFEMLASLMTPNQTNVFSSCSAEGITLPLTLSSDYQKSKMFNNLSTDLLKILTTEQVTANFHSLCLTPQTVTSSGLDKIIHVLSTNKDQLNLQFVSSFEAYNYPFYGIQWNPEKNPFEWSRSEKSIPHTIDGVKTAQYFANFFVQEARKNNHHFHKPEDEDKALMYNYKPYFMVGTETNFTEVYLFHNNTNND